jgi:chloramphenicol 3-O-phosphotransferase
VNMSSRAGLARAGSSPAVGASPDNAIVVGTSPVVDLTQDSENEAIVMDLTQDAIVMDLTQDVVEEEEEVVEDEHTLVGSCDFTIVGIR